MPAIVQDADTGAVLMLAYMNREALEQTLARKRAVFYSRSKQRLWEKGETTGHTLDVVDVVADCDNDTLLVTARPRGPACHNGTLTCFGDEPRSAAGEHRIPREARRRHRAARHRKARGQLHRQAARQGRGARRAEGRRGRRGSRAGRRRRRPSSKVIEESADLLFHLLVLLRARGLSLAQVVDKLESRHR